MLKTNRSMKKRIRVTGSGKFKRTRANKGHILTKKTRKRNLRRSAYVDKTEVAKVRRMLPYG
jgi:large subunit ribosomal protein L35